MWITGWGIEETQVPALCVTVFVFLIATLLERGRHAAYILLTGPGREGDEGTVVLGKRKLKQDVLYSTVLRIGPSGPQTNEDIKETFNRLRFSDQWNDQL